MRLLVLSFLAWATAAFAGEIHFQGDGVRIDLRSNDNKAFNGQMQIDGHSYQTSATLETPSKLVGNFKKGFVSYFYTVTETAGQLTMQLDNKTYPLSYQERHNATSAPQTTYQSTTQPAVQPAQAATPQPAVQQPQQVTQQPMAAASIPAGWATTENEWGYTVAYPSDWQKGEENESIVLIPANNNNEIVMMTNYPLPGFGQLSTTQQVARLQTEMQSLGMLRQTAQSQTFNAAIGRSVDTAFSVRNNAVEGIVRVIYTYDEKDVVLALIHLIAKTNFSPDLNKQTVNQIWQSLRRNDKINQQQHDSQVVGVWRGERVHSSSVANSYYSSVFFYTFRADGSYSDKENSLLSVDGTPHTDIQSNVNSINNSNSTGRWSTKGDKLYLRGKDNDVISYSIFTHTGNGKTMMRWGTKKPYTYLEKQN